MSRSVSAVLLALLVLAAGCGGGNGTGEALDVPLVLVTTSILGDVTANIAGDDARVEVLMPPAANPHSYQASARQAARMREADLIIANGAGLESGLLDVLAAAEADGVRLLLVGDHLDPEPFVVAGDEHDDGHAGETGEGLDPHVWMDPVRMEAAAGLIAAELAALGPGDFAARAAAYRAELEELSAYITARIATIPEDDRKLVTNHFAYGYFAERYGLELIGVVIPAATTDAETSPAEFAALVGLIEAERVPAIFGSTTEPVELAETIAAAVGHPVEVIQLYTGTLGEPGSGADTYLGMMHTSTDRIVAALTG